MSSLSLTRSSMLALILALSSAGVGAQDQSIRICQIDFHHLAAGSDIECPEGQLLQINSAIWGREYPAIRDGDLGTERDRYCPSGPVGDDQTLCAGDPDATLDLVRRYCQDTKKCKLWPANPRFGDPCSGVYKYLEVNYTCYHIQCECSLDSEILELNVFDEPDLMLYSEGQKTVLSSYKAAEHDPCKFKLQAVTGGSSAPGRLTAITFNIGKHPNNPKKFYRSYMFTKSKLLQRGVGAKKNQLLTLPYCWTSPDEKTQICIEQVGDVIQFRSDTCPYSLDLDIGTGKPSPTLYVEQSAHWDLFGMCGDCNNAWNGYVLSNGTDVSDVEDLMEKYYLITRSYLDRGVKRKRRA